MHGLTSLPTQKNLETAYFKLLNEKNITEIDYILTGTWTRFDPRLGEIWINSIAKNWKALSPINLNQLILASEWPALFGVLFDQVSLIISKQNHSLFKLWKLSVLYTVQKANDETYFLGLYAFGGKQIKQEVIKSIQPYTKWGLYSSHLMIAKSHKTQKTLVNSLERYNRIKEFFNSTKNRTFTALELSEYLSGKVHTRQIQRDLVKLKIKKHGNTKNTVYLKPKNK